jgi:hypothetical protein
MFPPVADSVHAFLVQPAIGQPESETLASESREPAGGLSRRLMLAGLAMLPAALPAAAAGPDPVYAAIERYRRLSVEYTAAVDRADLPFDDPDYFDRVDENVAAGDALFEQMELIFTFRPSTIAGTVASLKYICELEDWQMPSGVEDGHGRYAMQTFCASLAAALEQIGGPA